MSNHNVGYRRVWHGVSAFMLIFLLSGFLLHCSKPGEKLKPEGILLSIGDNYETELGPLEGKFLLQNGNQMRNGKIIFGAMYMDSKGAYKINTDIDVMKSEKKLDIEVTLVQNKTGDKWLATNGWVGINNGSVHLIDSTRVTVIGGKNNPIVINGKKYADTNLVAKYED